MQTPNTESSAEERVHHPFSPSSLQMREACPKFQQREGDVHEAAAIGTQQHYAVENPAFDDPKLEDYRMAAVQECIRFAEERARHFPNCTIIREAYLPVDDVVIVADGKRFEGTTAGYLDFGIVSEDELEAEVLDWKFGQNVVEAAKNNVQGISYALGLLKRYPKLQRITVRFIQPHIDYTSEHTFERAEFSGLLLRIRTIVNRAVAAANAEDDYSTARPNISSCLFCGLIGKCPKVAEFALNVGKKYRPLDIPAQLTPSLVKDPKDVNIGLRLAAVLAVWCEAFRRQATARTLDNPDFIPDGYTIVSTRRRSVKRAKHLGEVAKQFLPAEQHHLVEDLYDIALGKVEELIRTFSQRGQKDKTVELFGEKAIEAGAVELGQRFSYLKQDKEADKTEK